ncbi:MAG: Fis family transcriptional regulator, partial [Bacillaceae bacterium]|nr:Fis family transcriptional regulator [Bacillaceae bacterium]
MEIRLKINRKNGLHIRMGAAFISFLQSLIPDKEKLQRTYVIYNGKKVQANNLLSLVALKIKQGDEFTLVLDENTDQKTVEQIQAFFNQAASEDTRQTETDRLLMENSVTLHEAVSSIPNGIIVVNKENVIIYVNKAAAELLEKEPQDILNRRADEVIPHSCLHKILQTGKTEITEKQQINHYTVITTRSPILLNDQIIGAVAIFQDISSIEKISKELNEVKEL